VPNAWRSERLRSAQGQRQCAEARRIYKCCHGTPGGIASNDSRGPNAHQKERKEPLPDKKGLNVMDKTDAKKRILVEAGKIEKAEQTEARPADNLMKFHLQRSLPISHLGPEPRSKLINGSVDLYNRLRVRDPIDSLYAGAIVTLNNALMSAYGEATYGPGSSRDERLRRAYEGTALLIDLITTFENRRDSRFADPNLRARVLQDALGRCGLDTRCGDDEAEQ